MALATDVVGNVDAISLKFKWEINRFSASCKNVGDRLKSPNFTVNSDSSNIQWYLKLYPKGQSEFYKDYLALFLHASTKIKAVCNLKILSRTNGEAVVNHTTREYVFGTRGRGYSKFVLKDFFLDPVHGILKDDKLTILCEIFYRDDKARCNEAKSAQVERQECDIVPRHEVIAKYEALLNDSKFSDVSLSSEGKAVKVHKCILAKSSPVFAAMFKSEMKENQENSVEIADIRYDVLLEMIRFLYVGKVNDIDALAGELAVAADKYALDGLKDACEYRMRKNLSLENVVYCLQLADRLSMDKLKNKAIEFVVDNASEIVDKPEFHFLPNDIVRQAFCSLAKKRKY